MPSNPTVRRGRPPLPAALAAALLGAAAHAGAFQPERDVHRVAWGMLSADSASTLRGRIAELTDAFDELTGGDEVRADSAARGTCLLVALREWEPSPFRAMRRPTGPKGGGVAHPRLPQIRTCPASPLARTSQCAVQRRYAGCGYRRRMADAGRSASRRSGTGWCRRRRCWCSNQSSSRTCRVVRTWSRSGAESSPPYTASSRAVTSSLRWRATNSLTARV